MKIQILLLLFVASTALAQTPQPKPLTLGAQINATQVELDKDVKLEPVYQTALDATVITGTSLNASVAEVKKGLADLKTQQAAHDITRAQHNATAEAHNNPPCIITPDNNPCVAYHAEYLRLKAEEDSLRLEQAGFDKTKARLDKQQADNSDATLKWWAAKSKAQADWDANEGNITRLKADLVKLRKSYDDCVEAMKHGTLENMAEVCGQPFDGNAIHIPRPLGGTGGITPNK
jgi:hypothetical protein